MQADVVGMVAWLALGGLAGWLVGCWRGVGFGPLGDVAAGMAGALLGAWVLVALGAPHDVGLVVTVITAFLGAAFAVQLLRLAADWAAPYWRPGGEGG
jgi:uncharacterized membrane protein YeaQ/YmgE (transglycosylase-associated protein family)